MIKMAAYVHFIGNEASVLWGKPDAVCNQGFRIPVFITLLLSIASPPARIIGNPGYHFFSNSLSAVVCCVDRYFPVTSRIWITAITVVQTLVCCW